MNKIIIGILLVIVVGEGYFLFSDKVFTNSILLRPYSFTDIGTFVKAEGSWTSNTQLAYPIQTSIIECYKEFGHCWFTDAAVGDDRFLSLHTQIEKISRWDDDVVETVPSNTGFGCAEYTYRLDRRSKTATSTRRTIDTTGRCKGMQLEPIVLLLSNGSERKRSLAK